MQRSQVNLRTGWSMRDADDNAPEAWLPVEKVPSSVHVDLLANNKYGCSSSHRNVQLP
jgi:beta-mannosidase